MGQIDLQTDKQHMQNLPRTTKVDMTNQIWEWYYFPHTGHLGRYIQGQGCWIYTQKRPQSLHSPTFNLSRWSTTKPQDECRHATVVKCSRKKGRKYYKLDGGT